MRDTPSSAQAGIRDAKAPQRALPLGRARKDGVEDAKKHSAAPSATDMRQEDEAINRINSGKARIDLCAPPSAPGSYRCVVVDPPWDQGKTGRRAVRPAQGTVLDYPTLTVDEIAKVAPVSDWAAESAFLWLCATNSRSKSSKRPILAHAFDLMEQWGFRYHTMLTWNKGTGPCPFGPYQVITEHCLFGYRGKFKIGRDMMGQMRTCFTAAPTVHSEKPDMFYQGISQLFEGPRLDVFGRKVRPGFEGWGNEAH